MLGFRFTRYVPEKDQRSPFQQLLDLYMELLTYTAGDAEEATDWLRELDEAYNLSDRVMPIDEFLEELKKKGFIQEDQEGGAQKMTAKSEQAIRKRSLDKIFGKLKKGRKGDHSTHHAGSGEEASSDRRPFQFGDRPDNIAMTDSLRNAQINHGLDSSSMTEDDLEVVEDRYQTLSSTVLMIDISHSMILYGEDRITPAKKVAMALSELIRTKYPKDTLDIVVFGDDAWEIRIKELPYLQVGPYHTNTVGGLERAMDVLKRRKNPNQQIFMITDGKPTCIKEGGEYYINSMGMDPYIESETLKWAKRLRKAEVPVTTFMIAQDPFLKRFVEEFTRVNKGKAFYTHLQGLGELIFEDYEANRRRNLK
ncbi:MAG: VWA domain-containing protein [Flavobacteriales bacterium]